MVAAFCCNSSGGQDTFFLFADVGNRAERQDPVATQATSTDTATVLCLVWAQQTSICQRAKHGSKLRKPKLVDDHPTKSNRQFKKGYPVTPTSPVI